MRRARALSTLAASALALALATSCSVPSAPSGVAATDAATGAWSYDSGDGKTYTAEQVPTRVIAHAYAAKALMEFGITPVAVYADGPIAEDVGLQGADFSGIEVIGQEWGKIDVAAAADLQPDLIVGDWWPAEGAYSGLESGVEEQSKKIADLAPVVGPSQGDSAVELIEGGLPLLSLTLVGEWSRGGSSGEREPVDGLELHRGQASQPPLPTAAVVGPLDPRHDRQAQLLAS